MFKFNFVRPRASASKAARPQARKRHVPCARDTARLRSLRKEKLDSKLQGLLQLAECVLQHKDEMRAIISVMVRAAIESFLGARRNTNTTEYKFLSAQDTDSARYLLEIYKVGLERPAPPRVTDQNRQCVLRQEKTNSRLEGIVRLADVLSAHGSDMCGTLKTGLDKCLETLMGSRRNSRTVEYICLLKYDVAGTRYAREMYEARMPQHQNN